MITEIGKAMGRTRLAFALVAIGSLSLAACTRAPNQKLATTKVPPGFTFQTTHSVAATVNAAASITGPGGAALQISMNGHPLFNGHVMPDRPLAVHLAMPISEGKLVATLQGVNGPSTVDGVVADAKVSWQFQ